MSPLGDRREVVPEGEKETKRKKAREKERNMVMEITAAPRMR